MGLIVLAPGLNCFFDPDLFPICDLLLNISLIFNVLKLLELLLHLESVFFALDLVKEEFLLGLFLVAKLIKLLLQSLLGIRLCQFSIVVEVFAFELEVIVSAVGALGSEKRWHALVVVELPVFSVKQVEFALSRQARNLRALH